MENNGIKPPPQKYKIDALLKADAVLLELVHEDRQTFTQLQQRLPYGKATLYRILDTLLALDFISKETPGNRYRLGWGLAYYGLKFLSRIDVISFVEVYLQELADQVKERVNLSVRSGENIMIIKSFNSESSVLTASISPLTPMYCSASGKIFLANMPREEVVEYFNSLSCEKKTAFSITSYAQIEQELESARLSNIAFDWEENEYGLICIASSFIYSPDGKRYCVSISGPRSLLEIKGVGRYQQKLIECIDVINKKMIELR